MLKMQTYNAANIKCFTVLELPDYIQVAYTCMKMIPTDVIKGIGYHACILSTSGIVISTCTCVFMYMY